MKLYEVIIKPESGFGTPLKGDTIFGHICWQTAYDKNLLEGGLDRWIDCYAERPFCRLFIRLAENQKRRQVVLCHETPRLSAWPSFSGNAE